MSSETFLFSSLFFVCILSFLGVIVTYWLAEGTLKIPTRLIDFSYKKDVAQETIIFSYIATSLGGAVTVGFIGLIYKSGTLYLAAGIAFIIGLYFFKALVPRIFSIIEKNGRRDFINFLGGDSRSATVLCSLILIFIFFGLTIAQVKSLLLMSGLFFPNFAYMSPIVIGATIFCYGVYGYRGVLYSEKIQVAMMAAWIFVIGYVVANGYEAYSRISELEPVYLLGFGEGPFVLAALFVLLPWAAVARADIWQRTVSSETVAVARRGLDIFILCIFVVYLFMTLAGIWLKLSAPSLANFNIAAFEIVKNAPFTLIVMAVVGISAALISSADSFVNIAAVGLARMLNKNAENGRLTFVLSVGFLVLCLMLFSTRVGQLSDWIIMASTATAVLFPAFMYRIFRADRGDIPVTVSLACGVAGMVVFGLALQGTENVEIIFVPATILAVVGLGVGVKYSRD